MVCNRHAIYNGCKWNSGDLGHLYFYRLTIYFVRALVSDLTDSFASYFSSRSCTFPESYHSGFAAYIFSVYCRSLSRYKHEAEKFGTHSLDWAYSRRFSANTDNVDPLWIKCK